MVETASEAAARLGVSADVIDLRTLSLRDLDWGLIGASVARTNNVAVVEETARGTSIGAHVADELHRRLFDYLDRPSPASSVVGPLLRCRGRWGLRRWPEPRTLSGVCARCLRRSGALSARRRRETTMNFAELLAQPGPIFGSWSQFTESEPLDILAACGFAFTIIDTEHGALGLETAAGLSEPPRRAASGH